MHELSSIVDFHWGKMAKKEREEKMVASRDRLSFCVELLSNATRSREEFHPRSPTMRHLVERAKHNEISGHQRSDGNKKTYVPIWREARGRER